MNRLKLTVTVNDKILTIVFASYIKLLDTTPANSQLYLVKMIFKLSSKEHKQYFHLRGGGADNLKLWFFVLCFPPEIVLINLFDTVKTDELSKLHNSISKQVIASILLETVPIFSV